MNFTDYNGSSYENLKGIQAVTHAQKDNLEVVSYKDDNDFVLKMKFR